VASGWVSWTCDFSCGLLLGSELATS
jgi:hypothetical protein